MITLAELSRELGISLAAARRRLEALSRHLNGHLDGKVARGPRGKILVDETLAALLREAETLARESGITFSEALRVVASQLNGAAETSREAPVTVAGRSENPEQALARAVFWGLCAIAIAIFLGLTLVSLRL